MTKTQYLRVAGLLLVPAAALLITCLILLVELTYQLGFQLGSAIHARNDQLAGFWSHLWGSGTGACVKSKQECPVDCSEPGSLSERAPKAPVSGARSVVSKGEPEATQHPLMILADELSSLTVQELKALTGIKRKTRKQDLINACVFVYA